MSHVTTPLVLVASDLTRWGGMDRANYELALYLAEHRDTRVHLVSHFVAEPLAAHPNIVCHRVPKPLDSHVCGEVLLGARGKAVARRLSHLGARVIVNGGNCLWPDVNWVHAVHAAWDTRVGHAPVWVRARANAFKTRARRAERRAVRSAGVVLTNSHRARGQIITGLDVPPDRVRVAYYGNDSDAFRPASEVERQAARRAWDVAPGRRLALFVGALGHDRNKGFDILFDAWDELLRDPSWDVDLLAVGAGADLDVWRRQATARGLAGRVRLAGFQRNTRDLMHAADLLISPTHYDAYGLAVHEALCCGLPAFVSRAAGVAERYPAELDLLQLSDPPSAGDLVGRLRIWRGQEELYARRVACVGHDLRQRTWADMGREIAALLEPA